MVDSQTLGAYIRQAREQAGLSQEELAAALNKDQGAVSEYESGKRRLSALDLPILAETLRVPLAYFFEGDIPESDIDRLVLDAFRQLPSLEAKHAALDILHVLQTHFGTA